MNKKQPIKNDDTTINFRISKELKVQIEREAEKANLTTSAYVRELLESVHHGDYCEKEEDKSKINSFLYSKDFLQLMIWIYTKNGRNDKFDQDSDLERYIKTLKQVDEHLPVYLVKEFDKVLNGLLQVRSVTRRHGEKFDFQLTTNEEKKFNYNLVEEFFLNNKILETFSGDYRVYDIEKGFDNDTEM